MKKIIILISLILSLQTQVLSSEISQDTVILVHPQQNIDPDNLKLGDKVAFVISQPVKIKEETILEQNTIIWGVVTKKRNNFIFGVPGELEISNFQLTTSQNQIINFSGCIEKTGTNRYWTNVGILVAIPMLFIKGNDAKISEKTIFSLTVEKVSPEIQ